MQWFKHHNNFRNSPAMKHIAARLGDKGIAAVYRLYEVFTERFGIDNDFSGSLTLSPPTSEYWLLNEILSDSWYVDDPDGEPTIKDLMTFLAECELAGIIILEKFEDAVWKHDEKGVLIATSEKKVWTSVTIPGFAQLSDIYTHRKKVGKALETTR